MSHHFVKVKDLSYTYPGRTEPTLRDICLDVPDGSVVLITGPTGCGKSTLMKCFSGIIPHETGGVMTGRIQIGHLEDTRQADLHGITEKVGLVFQNPDEQIFTTMVRDEVAFGPENRGKSEQEIESRVVESLASVGLADALHRRTDELSGGQKQRVVIAGQLAVGHDILCLDEPFSQMDPQGAAALRETLKHLAKSHNTTIILVEHRVHEVAEFVDQVVIMEQGRIIMDLNADSAFKDLTPFRRLGLNVPQSAELFERMDLPQRPLTAEAALSILEDNGNLKGVHLRAEEKTNKNAHPGSVRDGQSKICIEDVSFHYNRNEPLFDNLNLNIRPGERVAVMGPNGCGKTTLLLLIAGLLKPRTGRILYDGKASSPASVLGGWAGFLLQNPDLMLIRETVADELFFPLRNSRVPADAARERMQSALDVMMIEPLKNDYCFALSRGQRLRTAVASLLTLEPEIVLLDEPTTGQDRNNINEMMNHFERSGKAMVFSTHDLPTALLHATRLLVMKRGAIQYDGPPRDYFSQDVFDPASALVPGDVTKIAWELGIEAPVTSVDDFISLWGRE